MTTMNEEERDQLHAEIARLRAELEADRGMYAGQLANAAHERDDALVEVTRLTAELAARPPIALDALGERRRIEALAQQHFEGAATDSETWYRIREFMLAMGSTEGTNDEMNELPEPMEEDSDPPNLWLRAGYLWGMGKRAAAESDDRAFLFRAARSLVAFARSLTKGEQS